MKTLAVLITVFNRKEKTLNCLKNLYGQKLPNDVKMFVFLTDDGCTDGTVDAIQKYYPQVNIVKGNGNLYWNRGMYAAWTEAEKKKFDYYLWLNDDTFLFDYAIYRLLHQSKQKEDKSIIVGLTVNSERTQITYGPTDIEGRLMNINIQILGHDSLIECPSFNGNIVLIPKYVYDIIGKNDPYYHHTLGDIDYGLRAFENGIRSYSYSQPSGICNRNEVTPKWRNPKIPLNKRLKALYMPGWNGHNPKEHARFKKKHFGIMIAVQTFIGLHIQTFFPKLWKKIFRRRVSEDM